MRERLTAQETLLVLLAVGITLLLSMFVSALYRHEYRPAVASFAPAAVLIYFFFRHRRVILTLVGLAFLFVNVGLHNMFHPSVSVVGRVGQSDDFRTEAIRNRASGGWQPVSRTRQSRSSARIDREASPAVTIRRGPRSFEVGF